LYARIDFGLIENGGSENEIVIQFEAIVVNSSQFMDASTYDVSANVTIDSYTATAVVSFTGVVQDLVCWLSLYEFILVRLCRKLYAD
jgi:hypothetical protein